MIDRSFNHGHQGIQVRWRGVLTVLEHELDEAIRKGFKITGFDWKRVSPTQLLLMDKPNLVPNSGVNNSLDRNFGLGGGVVITMGLDDGSSNPTSGTSSSSAGSSNRRLVAFDSTPVRTNQEVSCLGTFTEANVGWNSADKRLFLSRASAGTSDSAGDLYSMTNVFQFNFFTFSVWNQTFEALITGAGS